jgi:hypothetical protein
MTCINPIVDTPSRASGPRPRPEWHVDKNAASCRIRDIRS